MYQMDPVAMILGTSWTVTGLLIIGLCIPLAKGSVGPNRWYGVRLPQSYQSDEAWYAINRYGARQLIAWSSPLVVVGVVCFFLPLQPHPILALAMGVVPCTCMLMAALEIFRFARRYQSRT